MTDKMIGRAPLPIPGEVHLYFVIPEAVDNPALLARLDALQTPEERARTARYVFERHRHEHLMTRALVRTVLSHYVDRPPAAWRFRANEYGRPEIDRADAGAGAGDNLPPLQFNLSNTDGLVVCALTCAREVGVDVEPLDRRTTLDVAGRYFAPSEVAALRALPIADQPRRFLEYWTLKEAYIKARSMGLSIPLDHFAFTIEPAPIRIAFTPELQDDAGRWRFAQLRPTPRHLCAVAVATQAGDPAWARAEASVTMVRAVVPLVDVP